MSTGGLQPGVVRDCAHAVRDVFEDYHMRFRTAARRAARHFRTRDWSAVREETPERLRLYAHSVDHAVAQVVRRAKDAARERSLWSAVRDEDAGLVEGTPDVEIADPTSLPIDILWVAANIPRDILWRRRVLRGEQGTSYHALQRLEKHRLLMLFGAS
jgi:hypothetical protein